ncbi:MAG: hypothetical protein LBO68_04380 [Synergistaceae bacterium]|jgi:hypothetical protein|nr:hypothetical protein [Synergistaceae bacterium]
MTNRSGKLKTNLSGEAAYQSFMPSPLPPIPAITLDGEMVGLLMKAGKQLALLENIATRIPSVNLFVSMYVRKEAFLKQSTHSLTATGALDGCSLLCF